MPDFFNPSLLRFKSQMDNTGYFDPGTRGAPAPDSPRGRGQIPNGPILEAGWPGGTVRMDQNKGVAIDKPSDSGAPNRESIGQDDEITKLVSKLYTPGHEMADKFREVWNQMPQREKPSVLRRIVASMVSGGDTKRADEVLDAPYNQARTEWLDKLKMLQPLLGEERAQNINERQLATSAATQATANRRIGETERHNQETENLNKQKVEITKDRAAVYRYKAENPDHKFVEDENGQLMALDPRTGSMKYVLNEDGVPVKSLKNLDASEKLNLEIKGRKDVANIQAAAGIQRTREAGSQARETEKVKIQGRKDVKETKDANGEVTSRTTTVYDADGNVTGTRTENFTKAPIKPSDVKPNVGKVKMAAPDGRIIMVPMDKVKEAEERGAKRAK